MGQLYTEPVFGLRGAPYRWGYECDQHFGNLPFYALISKPSGALDMHFTNGSDTAEVVLIADCGNQLVRYLRISTTDSSRVLDYMGVFGCTSGRPDLFAQPMAPAVTSSDYLYNPDNDRIFIPDRMNNRLLELNYQFDRQNPAHDQLIVENSIYLDSLFYPIEIEFADFNTGYESDNRLIVLDDIGNRLCIFSRGGELRHIFDLSELGDTTTHIYSAFTHRIVNDTLIAIYLTDPNTSSVVLLKLCNDNSLEFVRELVVGQRMETDLTDILYLPEYGLGAVDNLGQHLYALDNNLRRVLLTINLADLGISPVFRPYKISALSERIAIFEDVQEDRGVFTLSFNRFLGKKGPSRAEDLPLRFALEQNYPNPFNSNTIINFTVPEAGNVKLEVFNILGQKVNTLVDEYLTAGNHHVLWNGQNSSGDIVASGVYLYRIATPDKQEVKKLVLLK